MIQPVLSLLVAPLVFVLWGLATAPGLYIFRAVRDATAGWAEWQQLPARGAAIGIGALLWCFSTLLMVGALGLLLRPSLDEVSAPIESWLTIRWGLLSLLHRTALPALKLLIPSLFSDLYYRVMGCTIGKGAQVVSWAIYDCFMVEIGARTIIGGEAVIDGHLFERDGIHLARVRIGSRVVIGAMARISPGCVIGDGAVIASGAVVPKFKNIPPGEVWGGVPARCIRLADGSKPDGASGDRPARTMVAPLSST